MRRLKVSARLGTTVPAQMMGWLSMLVAGVAAVMVPLAGAPSAPRSSGLLQAPGPVRALYVTGGGFHDFKAQEAVVPPGLSARVRLDWTVDHTAGTSTETLIDRHKDTAWTRDVDVVVYNMSFSHVVDPAWIDRLAGAHRDSGVGAVILHGAVHSYRRSTSRAWGELMGAFSMRHDRQRPFAVKAVAPTHPIMRGVPATWEPPRPDELYEIERTWPSMTTLAEAHSTETGKTSPVIWTNTHGKARVFVISLGHDTDTMAAPAYLDLVARGLLWTVNRLRDDGTPAPGSTAR